MNNFFISAKSMRQLEAAYVASGVTPEAMLLQAGQALATWICRVFPTPQRIVICVGHGYNGADGLVMAPILQAAGHTVHVWYWRPQDQWVAHAHAAGVACRSGAEAVADVALALSEATIVIDALLGMGVNRPLAADLADVVSIINQRPAQVSCIAIDLPSGCHADSGAVMGCAVRADITLSAGPMKQGLAFLPAQAHAGRIICCDVGIPWVEAPEAMAYRLEPADIVNTIPARAFDAYKYTFGRVVIWAGSRQYPGAAVLTSTAAARTGAGLVTLVVPESIVTWVWRQPEITLALIDETPHATLQATGGDAWIIGPGIGRSDATVSAVFDLCTTMLHRGDARPCVIDADALSILAQRADWDTLLPANCAVLTPHLGELRRLCGGDLPDWPPVELARHLAMRWQQVLVMKGSTTVVASPQGHVALWPHPNPALAIAGSGDVLAGVIGALLAQGLSLYQAACVGVALHGSAGAVFRHENGDTGVLASDIVAYVPKVLHALRQGLLLPLVHPYEREFNHADL